MISIIVAASENNIIGNNGDMPWKIKSDLLRFRQLTEGHVVIQGRKTLDSIINQNGRPLPKRQNYVISRTGVSIDGVATIDGDAFSWLSTLSDEVFVIGGGEIYRLALPWARRVYLTRVHTQAEGDTIFPTLSESEWYLAGKPEYHPASTDDQYSFSYLLYERL
ncbi:MAG: dihydrofolate reductase [Patescibacteria group bacterium]|jgi:dihydrofolate reductase|nr:dihydrofolate reductase [Patescibacteria group bacterium]